MIKYFCYINIIALLIWLNILKWISLVLTFYITNIITLIVFLHYQYNCFTNLVKFIRIDEFNNNINIIILSI